MAGGLPTTSINPIREPSSAQFRWCISFNWRPDCRGHLLRSQLAPDLLLRVDRHTTPRRQRKRTIVILSIACLNRL